MLIAIALGCAGYDADGNWIPTSEENAQRERLEKEAALAKSALLAEKLREMGIDPDRFS